MGGSTTPASWAASRGNPEGGPGKFALSFGLYIRTLAWMLAHVRRGRRISSALGWVVVVTSAIEMVIITGQAARGRRSHFNADTALQAIPLLGAVLAGVPRRLLPDRARLGPVAVAAGGYVGLVALLTWQALRGQPLVAPEGRRARRSPRW